MHLKNKYKHSALQSNFKLHVSKHFTKKASLSNLRKKRVGRVICLGLFVGKRKSQELSPALPCPQAGFNPLNLTAALALPRSSPDQAHGINPCEIPGKGHSLPLAGLPALCPCPQVVLPVEGPAGGHAPGKAAHPGLLEVRDAEDVGGDDGDGVGGVDEEAVLAQNHVAILRDTAQAQLSSLLSSGQELVPAHKPNNSQRFSEINTEL